MNISLDPTSSIRRRWRWMLCFWNTHTYRMIWLSRRRRSHARAADTHTHTHVWWAKIVWASSIRRLIKHATARVCVHTSWFVREGHATVSTIKFYWRTHTHTHIQKRDRTIPQARRILCSHCSARHRTTGIASRHTPGCHMRNFTVPPRERQWECLYVCL